MVIIRGSFRYKKTTTNKQEKNEDKDHHYRKSTNVQTVKKLRTLCPPLQFVNIVLKRWRTEHQSKHQHDPAAEPADAGKLIKGDLTP